MAKLSSVIYFDHNATTPLCSAARAAWLAAVDRFQANPSSPHRLGSRAEEALSRARDTVAGLLGCSPWEIIWTSGATEANNALFFHASRGPAAEVLISSIEHPSVIAAAHRWFPSRVRTLAVTSDGALDLHHLSAELEKSRPALVCVMAANNETGVLQPWNEALQVCRAHEVPFACDAAQWIGKQPAAGLGRCDFVVGCAHKFGGPAGVGFMKAPPGFFPLLVGGPQEDGRRAGTENVAGVLAMVAALEEREKQIAAGETAIREQWRDEFIRNLGKALPAVEILGGRSPRLWNTVAALMPASSDCRRRWVVQLDKLGCAVSTGSACASGKEKASHVLLAMGCDPAKADRMLRFTSGWETQAEEWAKLLAAIQQAAKSLR